MARSSRTVRRILASAVGVLALSAAAPAAPPVVRAGLTAPVRYVALGDSAAAAPGVPEQTDPGCLRSDHNYPSLVAARLPAAEFADRTCSGAKTADLADGQFDALRPDTSLVTLTIGANDIDFAGIVLRCTTLGTLHATGAPCRTYYGTALDQRVADTAPKVLAALTTIHQRSPHARILLAGYLNIVPDDHRGCRPRELFAAGDLAFLDALENSVNAMLAGTAAAGHAVFVDDHPVSAGHDFCRADAVRWTEALVPVNPAAPFHPNAAGEAAMAGQVLTAALG